MYLSITHILDVIGQQTGADWNTFGYDGLGSMRHIFDGNGASVYNATYDPYGGILSSGGTGASSLGYTGEMTDPSGLVYLRARYYNPAVGKGYEVDAFTQPDPVQGVMGGRAIRWNPYPYVGGNPVNITDPSGEFFPLLFAIGAGVVAGSAGAGAIRDFIAQMDHHEGRTECVDVSQVMQAAAEGALGALHGMSALIPPLGIAYAGGAILNLIDPGLGFTPQELNRSLAGVIGLDDEYDRLFSSQHFQDGNMAGTAFAFVASMAMLHEGFRHISTGISGAGRLLTNVGRVSQGSRVTVNVSARAVELAGAGVSAAAGSIAMHSGGGGFDSTSNVRQDVIDETNSVSGDHTSEYTLTPDEALDTGLEWVGHDYVEMGNTSSVFRSRTPNSDGTFNQFRIDSNSLSGAHRPLHPHLHLEVIRVGSHRTETIVNNHILLSP